MCQTWKPDLTVWQSAILGIISKPQAFAESGGQAYAVSVPNAL